MMASKDNSTAARSLLGLRDYIIFIVLTGILVLASVYAFRGHKLLGMRGDADLHGANLTSADLREADLRRANLSRADLRRARLNAADLTDANLEGADFRSAYLQGANFQNANMKDADLRGANLRDALNLQSAQILSARADEVTLLPSYLRETLNTKFDVNLADKVEIPFEPYKVAISQDGKLLASVGRDRNVHLWDVNDNKAVQRTPLSGPNGFVRSVAIDPLDNNIVAAGSDDGSIRIWQGSTQVKVINKPEEGYVFSLDYSADGQFLVSASRNFTTEVKMVHIWKASDLALVSSLRLDPKDLIIDIYPDQQLMALFTELNGTQLRPIGNGLTRVLEGIGERVITSGAFSSGAELLALGVKDGNGGTVLVWGVDDTRQVRSTLTIYEGTVTSLAFSPDRQLLAVGWSDGSIRLWRQSGGVEPVTMTGHSGNVQGLAFSGDGRKLVSIGVDKTILLWNIAPYKFS
ncbi:MAG TPA: pentapeptide repeat-containing protein [Pyrinomonadaceae bacterium]|jgi:WD40 repeat protein